MIAEIRIDEALWATASRLRRDDWLVSIEGLLEDPHFGAEDEHRLDVHCTDAGIVCATLDAHAAPRHRHEVRTAELRTHVDEYAAVIRRLHGDDGESPHSARMAALDMAKRVVHDRAARMLARTMPGLAREHETYRRLFSLLFALVVDVSLVPGARAHRTHPA